MQQTVLPSNQTINDVKQHFDHWRTTRTKRGKIPEHLWDKVKSIIGKYPLTTITETLHINTNQIREHIDLNAEINFIEAVIDTRQSKGSLNHTVSLNHDERTCSIELHRTAGGVLKINDYPIESLPTIINHFLG